MNESLKRYYALREIALDSGLQKDWDAVFKAQVAAEKEQQAGVPPLTESPATAYYPKVLKEEKPMPKKNLTDTGTTIPGENEPRKRASGVELIEKRAAKVVADLATLGESALGEMSEPQAKELAEAISKKATACCKKILEARKEPEQETFHFTK